jgi:hypothetical protein
MARLQLQIVMKLHERTSVNSASAVHGKQTADAPNVQHANNVEDGPEKVGDDGQAANASLCHHLPCLHSARHVIAPHHIRRRLLSGHQRARLLPCTSKHNLTTLPFTMYAMRAGRFATAAPTP